MPPRSALGFTLLEVMIAISIFAFLAVGSYQLLNSEISAQNRLAAHSQKLYNWQRTMRLLLDDFQQAAARGIRAEYGDKEPAMEGLDDRVSFTRSGWPNPFQAARSTQQRVSYSIDRDDNGNTYLLRRYWNVLDRGQDTEPREQIILTDVDELTLRYRDKNGKWFDRWPPASYTGEDKENLLPIAVKITLNTQALGEISRLIEINRVQPKKEKPEQPPEEEV